MKNTNKVIVKGTISNLCFEYERDGETFYRTFITVKRQSGNTDTLRMIISNKLLSNEKMTMIKNNEEIIVSGEYRSRNVIENDKSKLQLYIFAQSIVNETDLEFNNYCELDGYICKKPVVRNTPFGRTIADMMLAVNRTNKKSDYIPIILWGRNANFVETLDVGSFIKIVGRIQSRTYNKQEGDRNIVHVAYEVSAKSIMLIGENDATIE